MKCQNCGFISSREFYRCPYCGHVQESENDILKTRLSFGGGFSIRIRTILYGFFINILGISVLVDWFFDFKYSISLWSFILCAGSILLIGIIFMKRKSIYSIEERIDIYLLVCLILCSCLCRIDGLFDLRIQFATLALPAFLILATAFSAIVFLIRRTSTTLRPIMTDALLLFHALVATTLFIFLLVNKYSVQAELTKIPFQWMQFGMTKGNLTPLYILEEVLIFTAFGASWAYLINYNLILVGFIYRKVINIYGGEGD